MPSKKVFIKCKQAFIHESIKSEAAIEQLGLAKRGVSSFFLNKYSTRKGTGLTDEEVKLLLPQILDIRPDDLEFRKKVDLFYTEIYTTIPYVAGKELEIGLEYDNSLPVTYTEGEGDQAKFINKPINPEEYIIYRHALANPKCGKSPEEAKGDSTLQFYVEDPEQTILDRLKLDNEADKANMLYQQIKTDDIKVKMILTLGVLKLPKKPGETLIIDSMSVGERQLKLKEFVTSKPKDFYAIASDDKLKNRYLITELINVNLIKRAGTAVLVTESDEVLGTTLEDAMNELFNNPARAQFLQALKGSYFEKKALK